MGNYNLLAARPYIMLPYIIGTFICFPVGLDRT